MNDAVQTAIIGVTGYAGAELARLLLHHPRLKGVPPLFAGRLDEKDIARGGVPLSEIHPQLTNGNGSASLKQHAARAVASVGSRGARTRTARR